MNIGFDAKRAYHNSTGLGHYSRNLIRALSAHYPEHNYYLFNPKPSGLFSLTGNNIHEIRPSRFFHKLLSSAWRSSWVKKDLLRYKIDIYHGLSHEIPIGIQLTGIKSVVTIHDLIHERYPLQYNPVDVKIYHNKFSYACSHADKVIAISEQTRRDIMEYYKTPEEKIVVCYQHCDPAFGKKVSDQQIELTGKKYNLPQKFFLYVGSVIERKNLLNICKAFNLLKNEMNIPLVVIGSGGKYLSEVKDFISKAGIGDRIIFLSETPPAKEVSFKTAMDFPAIYQSALAMIYPSFFEGFGIPVLEALCSGLPVITSNVSSLPEVGGDAALYVNPSSPEDMADAIRRIYSDENLRMEMKEKGLRQAQHFTPEKCAAAVMNVYLGL
jgi:glycosyltransferase involved in cell wall biosynthesis